jgi:hypothetical protein
MYISVSSNRGQLHVQIQDDDIHVVRRIDLIDAYFFIFDIIDLGTKRSGIISSRFKAPVVLHLYTDWMFAVNTGSRINLSFGKGHVA